MFGLVRLVGLFILFILFAVSSHASVNQSRSQVKSTPDINIKITGHDLLRRTDVYGEYFIGADKTLMMYSASKTTSDKPIKKVEWTYDGVTWEGWTFFPYLTSTKGDTITVKVTNNDNEFVTEDIEVIYSDFCELNTRNPDFGFCLKSNNISADGDYIPLNIPFLNFYISHGETLTGNLTNRKVYLVSESTGAAIDITSATSLSGSNLRVNMITLGSSLALDDPTDKFYLALYGDYNTVTATFDYENTNARSQSFKLGMSGLNLLFGETVHQLSIHSVGVPFGKTLQSNVGTSFYNLSYLPPGEYIIHVENATKEGYAQVYVNPEELVTVSFSMQPKDLSAIGRQPLSDSYTVTRSVFFNKNLKLNSKPKSEQLKSKLNDLSQKYKKEYEKVKAEKQTVSPLAGIVYWNGFTRNSVNFYTQYTQAMFINNYETLKSQFLDPLPIPLRQKPIIDKDKEGQNKTFVSAYPPFPNPLVSVYNMKVQGDVPNGYVSLPNKNQDFGIDSAGIPVEPGKNYAPFMFGDLPILHASKSKEVIAMKYRECVSDSVGNPVALDFCDFEHEISQEAWKVILDFFSLESTVRVRYTITGIYDSQEHEIVYDHTYDFETFVKENGDLYVAASKYIYSPEGTDINDGWLLGKQPYIHIPDYLTNPKVRLELFTTIPDDIFNEIDDIDMKVYIAGGLVKDERELPSVENILPLSSAVDVRPYESPVFEHPYEPIIIYPPVIPFKTYKSQYGADENGKRFLKYLMLPVTEDATPYAIYNDYSKYNVDVVLNVSSMPVYSITGVSVSAKYGDMHFPQYAGSPTLGIEYIGGSIVWPYGDTNHIKLTFNPLDVFGSYLVFDENKDESVELEFRLILDYLPTTTVDEKLLGPLNRIITASPSFSFADDLNMNYPVNKLMVPYYSKPHAGFAKKALATVINTLVNSDLNTSSVSSPFKYNDASLPYGGKDDDHKAHLDGRNLDIRYLHPANEEWDRSMYSHIYNNVTKVLEPNNSFNTLFCGASYGSVPLDRKLYHGYKKHLTIRNYLWIKRLVSQIHKSYKDDYADSDKKQLDPKSQTHRGQLISYIVTDICTPPFISGDTVLDELCDDLKQLYTANNLQDIDDLISYIDENRDSIEYMLQITGDKKSHIKEILLSDGARSTSCFPRENSEIGFTYSANWHEKLFKDGLLPDGADPEIGTWSPAPQVRFNENDDQHLSHMHLTVE